MRQQLAQPGNGVRWETREDIGEPGKRLDAAPFTGGDEAAAPLPSCRRCRACRKRSDSCGQARCPGWPARSRRCRSPVRRLPESASAPATDSMYSAPPRRTGSLAELCRSSSSYLCSVFSSSRADRTAVMRAFARPKAKSALARSSTAYKRAIRCNAGPMRCSRHSASAGRATDYHESVAFRTVQGLKRRPPSPGPPSPLRGLPASASLRTLTKPITSPHNHQASVASLRTLIGTLRNGDRLRSGIVIAFSGIRSESMKSIVSLLESTARYRYIDRPPNRM